MGAKENEISNDIIRHISGALGLAWRNNSGGIKVGKRFIHLAPKGSPDIIGVIEGLFVGVETKVKGGKLSDVQKMFKQNIEVNGGVYILAHSLDEFLKEWYAFKHALDIKPEEIIDE